MSSLQLAPMDRLLRKAGARRVSEKAKEALRDVIEEFSDELCKKAVMLAKHAGRTTVKAVDIKLASKG